MLKGESQRNQMIAKDKFCLIAFWLTFVSIIFSLNYPSSKASFNSSQKFWQERLVFSTVNRQQLDWLIGEGKLSNQEAMFYIQKGK